MTSRNSDRRPAEIFGYPVRNRSTAAEDVRRRHFCPFRERECDKKSRLIDFPFGVCSVQYGDEIRAICPRRFEERRPNAGVSRVLEDIALHYFGSTDNTIVFPEVKLPNVGNIDYVITKHKPMQPEVDDFVAVEFQSDSTSSTGELVRGIKDFFEGGDVAGESYKFGSNTYDTIKRAITQLMNKGIVYEAWDAKCYWVIQEYIYANLVNRYGVKDDGFSPDHASRFALYNIVPNDDPTDDRLTLTPTRYVSTSVDEVYQAMRNNPALPVKDKFVQDLNRKLQLRLLVQ